MSKNQLFGTNVEMTDITVRQLKKVNNNRWETNNGDYIWKDDFGSYQIKVNTTYEITNSLERAVAIINNPKYYN